MIRDEAVQTINTLDFANRFTRELPADPQIGGASRQVQRALYSRVLPTAVARPRLLAWVPEVAALLDPQGKLQSAAEADADGMAAVLAGNVQTPGMDPHATRYGGHQFGNWAGQLGDGRAINLGEIATPTGQHWTVQLKGAGPTPYSRFGDGRAVLRSSVREFLCSEAMHHLGVPTTRALSLVLTGESVVRDMFYDGNPKAEPGAVVCRVAQSFVRFGHFQMLAADQEYDLLERLLIFVIRADWPELAVLLDQADSLDSRRAVYLLWFRDVCDLTQRLAVEWMRVGFVHGVLNTDNMSILGQTIDYGPYGWIDDYNPDWTPNTTDAQQRRYRFSQQPVISRWNLYQLANCLVPLFEGRQGFKDTQGFNDTQGFSGTQGLQDILDALPAEYAAYEQRMMADKLGVGPDVEGFDTLRQLLEKVLRSQPVDMTLFYRGLMQFRADDPLSSVQDCIQSALYRPKERQTEQSGLYQEFEACYRQLVLASGDEATRQGRMEAANPIFVLRNYIAQQVIDDLEQGNEASLHEALRLLRQPYRRLTTGKAHWYDKRPDWARDRPGCSTLSCSS